VSLPHVFAAKFDQDVVFLLRKVSDGWNVFDVNHSAAPCVRSYRTLRLQIGLTPVAAIMAPDRRATNGHTPGGPALANSRKAASAHKVFSASDRY
jgi:hypothetical protein